MSLTSQVTTRILGIDPGLNISGYGVLDITDARMELVEAGIVRTKQKNSLEERLVDLHRGISEVIDSLKPDFVAIEKLYSHYERPTTAIMMGHARGVIFLAAGQKQLPVCDYAATQIKKVMTGNGRAPKVQVQLAVARQLNLDKPPEPADVADALAIAICHYFVSRRPAALQ